MEVLKRRAVYTWISDGGAAVVPRWLAAVRRTGAAQSSGACLQIQRVPGNDNRLFLPLSSFSFTSFQAATPLLAAAVSPGHVVVGFCLV